MLDLYAWGTFAGKPFIHALLQRRVKQGKEDPERLPERMGTPSVPRPQTPLIWIHAASVGEAQSALILLETLLKTDPKLHILVTTGTRTSAELMGKKLPDRAFHQYYPIDHPQWVRSFLNYWKPDGVLWMESELWPNMLREIKKRKISAMLVNARLSPRSFKRWTMLQGTAKQLLSVFDAILCQTEADAKSYIHLGGRNIQITDNLKYSAAPLSADTKALKALKKVIGKRPCWVYASSHEPEESIAADIHGRLKDKHPDLLTIIVPRHPDRRVDIRKTLSETDLKIVFRGEDKNMPDADTDIYVADTLGELGLFYTLCDIALIGRSLSSDGGGGHNPIEAAQLGSAVLHGPLIQNLQDIYDDMADADAAIEVKDADALYGTLDKLLSDPKALKQHQKLAEDFATTKTSVLDRVMEHVYPMIEAVSKKREKTA
ncbi:MAG: 3-deoxy-D-manno-octulosonic acid transferase [Alphaproteobacteria bacterium]|nr:3-deoxy-D-manno-octulosonic acid transferase [Alphaproteobacteria bacterium]